MFKNEILFLHLKINFFKTQFSIYPYILFQDPITHLQGTQESKNGIWHLPYQEFKEPGSWSKPDSSPDKWMCIKNIFSD